MVYSDCVFRMLHLCFLFMHFCFARSYFYRHDYSTLEKLHLHIACLSVVGLALAQSKSVTNLDMQPSESHKPSLSRHNMQAKYHKVVHAKQPQSQASSATWSDTQTETCAA